MAGLYIHIPFCRSKCVYCGFFSIAGLRKKDVYLSALRREISMKESFLPGVVFTTLYVGGGTPTLLGAGELERLLGELHGHFSISRDAEATVEANPEQLTPDYCRGLKRAGFNRVSIGVQSFQDNVLRFMGRGHDGTEARRAVENAACAGFSNISVDLIYGVEERRAGHWQLDLETAFALPAVHLSAYALTVEENSVLRRQIDRGHHAPVTGDLAADEFVQLCAAARRHGFRQYEVSNFCRPGFESRHNSAYWQQTPYLGLGAAAHSYDGQTRQWNAASVDGYVGDIAGGRPFAGRETLTDNDRFNEAVMLGLRTAEGIDTDRIGRDFGPQAAEDLRTHFANHVPTMYYIQDSHSVRLTGKGMLFADGIAAGAFRG